MDAFFQLFIVIVISISAPNGMPLQLSSDPLLRAVVHGRSLLALEPDAYAAFPSIRQNEICNIYTPDNRRSRTILQINGTGDGVATFAICSPTSGTPLPPLTFTSSSSRGEVLQISNDPSLPSDVELQVVSSQSCINATAYFSFDNMVGITVYTLSAHDQSTKDQLCTASVQFTIAGLNIFEEVSTSVLSTHRITATRGINPNIETTSIRQAVGRSVPSDTDPSVRYFIRSGDSAGFIMNYRDVLNSTTRDFKVRVQFPDGTNSTSLSTSVVNNALLNVKMASFDDATSPVRFDGKECPNFQSNVSVSLRNGTDCGVAFGEKDATIFTVRYEPYKDGSTSVTMDWPDFTLGDDDVSEEAFSTIIQFAIGGDPPPVVDSIEMPDTIYRAGGQEITVVFDNSERSENRTLKVGDAEFPEIPGSYRRLENGLYEAKFKTLPGAGTEIPWSVKVYEKTKSATSKIVKKDVKDKLSYITVPLQIGLLKPPWGKDSQKITLQGYFDGFDPARDGHNIFIGEKSIAELGIISSVVGDQNQIVLTAPSREIAGSAYNYPIRVVVNNETTDAKLFSYIPANLNISIDAFGGSFDEKSGEYVLGQCESSTYIVTLPSGITEPENFRWKLVASEGGLDDVLGSFPDVGVQQRSLTLQARAFKGNVGPYVVSISCVLYGRRFNASMRIRKTASPVIGVTLSRIPSRSLALPNLPLRVDAIVTLPGINCYALTFEIVYVWTAGDVKRTFSFANVIANNFGTDENFIHPTRLGRELVMSQSSLRYGNLSISLLTFVKEDPSILGNATTSVMIRPAELVPVIGFGEAKVLHSLSSDLEMIGNNSVSPDEDLDNRTSIVHYEWTCTMSLVKTAISPLQKCPLELLPSKIGRFFMVQADDLQQAREDLVPGGGTASFYITYSLRVQSNMTSSVYVSQLIEVISTVSPVASLTDLQLMNGRNTHINWQRIRFYDDMIVVPQGINMGWKFSALVPMTKPGLFQTPENFLANDGYYDPSLNSSQSLPLGIKAWGLKPAQDYEILLSLRSNDRRLDDGAVVIQIRTVDRPKLMLPSLALINGTTDTIFSASARVNLDSDSAFSFFFFLVTEDQEEICLDGCSGRSTVQFSILESGIFRILVRLRDVQGTSVLDEQFYSTKITVGIGTNMVSALADGNTLESFDPLMQRAYRYGDHGGVHVLSALFTRHVRMQTIDTPPEKTANMLTLYLSYMSVIVRNSVPTALTARGYIQTASHFARLTPSLFLNTAELFMLIAMVNDAVTNVPVTEAVDTEEDLLLFYNLSMRHAISPFQNAFTSARMSFRQSTRLPESFPVPMDSITHFRMDVTAAARWFLMDFFASMQRHLTLVLSRDAVCGSTKSVNTTSSKRISFDGLNYSASVTNPYHFAGTAFHSIEPFEGIKIPSLSVFTIAIVCHDTDAQHLEGLVSKFSWCGNDFVVELEAVETPEFVVSPEPLVSSEPYDLPTSKTIDTKRISELPVLDTRDTQRQADLLVSRAPIELQNQKKLFVMMETLDYTWLSGFVGDNVRTETSFLITANATILNGTDLEVLASPSERCYSVNTSLPRLGLTEDGGCFSSAGFSIDTSLRRSRDGRQQRRLTRNSNNIRSTASKDNTSTVLLQSNTAGIIGATGMYCPITAGIPLVELPEGADDFLFNVFSITASVSATVYIMWVGTSSYYATFTTAAVIMG